MTKDPQAVLDYEFDWAAWLASGETIASFVVTVAGVALDSSAASTTAVTAWISGGTLGELASVACRITTTAGRIDERSLNLVVEDR
jgi:hypothetical protein